MFKFRDTFIKEVVIVIGISENVIPNNRIIVSQRFYIIIRVILTCGIKSNFPPLLLHGLTDSFVVKIYFIFYGN